MVNKITTATVIGLNAYEVCLETDVQNGLPSFSIVGLPDTAITEARDRVRSAVKNSGFSFPAKKIIINLAPADLKKVGTSFDLPIAIGLIIEEGILEVEKTKDYAFIGELSLNGDLRSVRGILPLVIGLKELGIKNVTSFGVYMDSAYFEAYPDTTPLKEYGEGLNNYVLENKE